MQPFLVWFQHRSGSTHLVSLLNSHTEIKCKGEVFGCFPVGEAKDLADFPECRVLGEKLFRRLVNRFPGRLENPTDANTVSELKNYFSEKSEFADKMRGFKFKFPSQAKLFPEITSHLQSLSSELRIITLTRKNFVRRAISVMNLESVQSQTDRANVEFDLRMEPKVYNVQEVIRLVRYYQEIDSEFVHWARQFNHRLTVEYEDLVNDQESVCNRIQKFLQVNELQPLQSRTKKITPPDLQDHVKNLDELQDALAAANIRLE